MEPIELNELVKQPEGVELEFKARLPNTKNVASLISAFANTNGGKLVVGVKDDGAIVGLKNVDKARSQIEKALKAISPPIRG